MNRLLHKKSYKRYLSENKKDYIKSVAEKVYQTATEEKESGQIQGM